MLCKINIFLCNSFSYYYSIIFIFLGEHNNVDTGSHYCEISRDFSSGSWSSSWFNICRIFTFLILLIHWKNTRSLQYTVGVDNFLPISGKTSNCQYCNQIYKTNFLFVVPSKLKRDLCYCQNINRLSLLPGMLFNCPFFFLIGVITVCVLVFASVQRVDITVWCEWHIKYNDHTRLLN